jgi:hypothetical protein
MDVIEDIKVFLVSFNFSLLSHKKIVLLRNYQLMQPTYISNIGLYHAMHSRYMFVKCKWWMTYGQDTDIVGSINTRNICLILSTIYSFISVSVFIDMGPSTLLWPEPILLLRQPWPWIIFNKGTAFIRHVSAFTYNIFINIQYFYWLEKAQ